jgi:nucleoside-diphosphate-sugar epimerase
MINDATGKSVKPIYTDPRPGDVKHSLADISLAKELIGFKPVISFEDGLQLAIDWYRENLV